VTTLGFVGLGHMGGNMAVRFLGAGYTVYGETRHRREVEDLEHEGLLWRDTPRQIAEAADVVLTSVPNDGALEDVASGPNGILAGLGEGKVWVDVSTVSPQVSRDLAERVRERGAAMLDAPVSGGAAGARARTLTVMYAGSPEACAAAEPVLAGLSDRRYRVGDEPGMAQALKLANNFLSATALAATSEAIAFGTSVGLDMATMLEVLNASSGQSSATSDKFVNHVVTGRFSSGFLNTLMAKDVRLYLEAAIAADAPALVAATTVDIWNRFAADQPAVDFTRIYPFTAGEGGS